MEIIHIILGKANPERMNGVNKVVYQLATRQALSGEEVSVWGITPSPEHNYGTRSFKTQLYKASSNPFCVPDTLVRDLRLNRGKAIVHLHGGWIPVFARLSKILSKLKIPFVFTPHGAYNTIAMKRSGWRKRVYFQFFEKHLLKRTLSVHCIGESEVTGLNGIFKTSKTFLLPYGFEAPSVTGRRAVHEKQFVVGFVGRLDIYTKGLDLLLDAFEDFHGRCSNAVLWIVGDSDERTRLEQMIVERHLEQHVIVWGSKFGKDKDELIQQMDVFVHPSRNEGLPSAVLEAASQGIPCVVSTATNVGSYIRQYNAGIEVGNEHAEQLSFALRELCLLKQAGKLEDLGNNGKRMVAEIFNWNAIVPQFDKLYQLR